MSYYIKREEVNTAEQIMLTKTDEWNNQLSTLKDALSAFVDADAITGSTADNIRDYINEGPIEIINAFIACLDLFQMQMLNCANGYGTIDSNESAKVSTGRLKTVAEYLSLRNEYYYNTREAINTKLNTVSDIITFNTLSNTTNEDFTGLNNKISELETLVTGYEDNHVSDMDNVNDILVSLKNVLNAELNRSSVQMSSYAKGSLPKDEDMKKLGWAIKKIEDEKNTNEYRRTYVENILAAKSSADIEDIQSIGYTAEEIDAIYEAYQNEPDKNRWIYCVALATTLVDEPDNFKAFLSDPDNNWNLINKKVLLVGLNEGKKAGAPLLFNYTSVTASLLLGPLYNPYLNSKKLIAEKNRVINNRVINSEIRPINGGFINNQYADNLKNVRYGLMPYSKSGCGPTATYNALYEVSNRVGENYNNPNLQDVLYDLEEGNVFYSAAGTSSEYMNNYINYQFSGTGYSAQLYPYREPERYDELMENGDIGIIEFWTGDELSSPAHYVMIEKEDGEMFAHNVDDTGIVYKYDSFVEMLSSKGRVISFILIREDNAK